MFKGAWLICGLFVFFPLNSFRLRLCPSKAMWGSLEKKVGGMKSIKDALVSSAQQMEIQSRAPNSCCTSRAIVARADLVVLMSLVLLEIIYRSKGGLGVFTGKSVVSSEEITG